MVLAGRFRLENKNQRNKRGETTREQEGDKGKFKSCVLDYMLTEV